uniref:Uncharacterized protein n=1 Tax=Oryza nivara TaxID=4536 RepID=A0A0E0FHA1_ORYNI
MERVHLLRDAALSAPRQLFPGDALGGFGRSWTRFLTCDFPFYPRPRHWEEEADGGGEEPEAAARERERGERRRRRRIRGGGDDVVVVAAAVATSSALASSKRRRRRLERTRREVAPALAGGRGRTATATAPIARLLPTAAVGAKKKRRGERGGEK